MTTTSSVTLLTLVLLLHMSILSYCTYISPSRHITSSTVFSAGKPLMQLCLQMLVSLVHKGYSTSLFLNSLVLSNSVTPSVVFMSAGIYNYNYRLYIYKPNVVIHTANSTAACLYIVIIIFIGIYAVFFVMG